MLTNKYLITGIVALVVTIVVVGIYFLLSLDNEPELPIAILTNAVSYTHLRAHET